MAQSPKAAQQVKKKKWVQILAPKSFDNAFIGETYISEFSEAIGREVSVSLMALSGDPQKQNTILSFKMASHNNAAIITEIIGYRISPSAVRKTMRRGKEKVEDSFEAVTQDNIKVAIKPLLVTKGRATGGVLTNLRKHLHAYLVKVLSATTFENVLIDLMSQKFQRSMSDVLRKVYPLSVCEIKIFSIVKNTKDAKSEPKEALVVVKEELKQEPVSA